MELFALEGPLAAIDSSGDFTGVFYLDDLRLAPTRPSSSGPTVVEERTAR